MTKTLLHIWRSKEVNLRYFLMVRLIEQESTSRQRPKSMLLLTRISQRLRVALGPCDEQTLARKLRLKKKPRARRPKSSMPKKLNRSEMHERKSGKQPGMQKKQLWRKGEESAPKGRRKSESWKTKNARGELLSGPERMIETGTAIENEIDIGTEITIEIETDVQTGVQTEIVAEKMIEKIIEMRSRDKMMRHDVESPESFTRSKRCERAHKSLSYLKKKLKV